MFKLWKTRSALILGIMLTMAAFAGQTALGAEPVQQDFQGGVLLEITLDNPATFAADGYLVWDMELTTHSGDLRPLQPDEQALLRDTGGNVIEAEFQWELTRDDAHHPAGRLLLPLDNPNVQRLLTSAQGSLQLELVLRDFAGAEERSFRWEITGLEPADMEPTETGSAAATTAAAPADRGADEAGAQGVDPAATPTHPCHEESYVAYVTNAGDGTISVVDLSSMEVSLTWKIGEEASHGLALGGDGRLLWAGTGSEGTILGIDTLTGRIAARIPAGSNVHGIDGSPDGRYVFAGSGGTSSEEINLVRIDTHTGEVRRLSEGLLPVGHIDVSPDGRFLFAANLGTDSVTVLDVASMEVVKILSVGEGPNESRVTPDGRWLFVANWNSSDVTVVDLETWENAQTLTVGEGTHGVGVTPDGKEVWIANRISNDVIVLDTASRETIAELPAGEYTQHLRFTPDGRLGLVTNGRDNELMVFDVASREVIARVPVGETPHEIAIGTRIWYGLVAP